MEIATLINKQREFFYSDQTKDTAFRKHQLKKFKDLLRANEDMLNDAIYKDFRKSPFETFETELALLYGEINNAIENLDKWAGKNYVPQTLANLPGKSYIVYEPLGVSLVIGAWNYPYLLSLHPALSAIAAGNTVIVKPSELASNASAAMAKLINENFNEGFFHIVEGGVDTATELLKQPFDKIFYTGSTRVGKIVAKAAAEHLTPVTLELGGKSPAFVWTGKKMDLIARRIAWGKFLNCGQTCVAPDYVIVKSELKQAFIDAFVRQVKSIYGENLLENEAYPRIINKRHFDRLISLIDKEKVVFGGNAVREERFIEPTVMDRVSWDDKIMQDEIFGPILPVLTSDDLDKAVEEVRRRPKPLALYVFTDNKGVREKVFSKISFGGGVQNETVMHLANHNLPFGGVGSSGQGNYHGFYGFKTFSHEKALMTKPLWFEPPVKYPPYTKTKEKLLRWLFK